MRPLSYARVEDVDAAVALVSADPASAFLAGGTTKVDLVRIGVDRSDRLIDINRLPLASVEEVDGGILENFNISNLTLSVTAGSAVWSLGGNAIRGVPPA